MNSRLSISTAWDRTKARFASDGGLLLTVALALIALPSAIAEFAFPERTPMGVGGGSELVTVILVAIIGIIGQLALVRLALGRSVSVGEAIAHGARRMPVFLVSVLLLLLAFFIIAIPFGIVLAMIGVTMTPGATPTDGRAALAMLVYLVLIIFLSTRLVLSAPVASMEDAGPLAILRRSWDLTSGHFWRIFGFLMLFLIAALVVVIATGTILNLIVVQLFGAVEPLTVSALIIALVVSLVTAAITAMFIVMAAEIYAQLEAAELEVSVPSSGT